MPTAPRTRNCGAHGGNAALVPCGHCGERQRWARRRRSTPRTPGKAVLFGPEARPATAASCQGAAAFRGRPRPCCRTGPARGRATGPERVTQPPPQAGAWGLEDSVGCGERGPHPPSGPARLLSSPRPPRDEIPGTSLVAIVTLRPGLSCVATEEASANERLRAVWGTPPWCGRGSGGAGGGGAWATRRDARLAAAASTPPRSGDISGEHPRAGARPPPASRRRRQRVQPLARRVGSLGSGWVQAAGPWVLLEWGLEKEIT